MAERAPTMIAVRVTVEIHVRGGGARAEGRCLGGMMRVEEGKLRSVVMKIYLEKKGEDFVVVSFQFVRIARSRR